MPGGGGDPGTFGMPPPDWQAGRGGGPPAIGPANLDSYGVGRFGNMFRGRMGGGMGAGAMSFNDVAPPVAGEDAGAGGMGWDAPAREGVSLLAAFQYCTHVAIENCTLGALT